MLRITEGIEGTYRYHLSKENEYVSLCGVSVMNANFSSLDRWGEECMNTAIHYRWCSKCVELSEGV